MFRSESNIFFVVFTYYYIMDIFLSWKPQIAHASATTAELSSLIYVYFVGQFFHSYNTYPQSTLKYKKVSFFECIVRSLTY